MSPGILLDHLSDVDIIPRPQARPSSLRRQRFAERAADSLHIGLQAIDAKEQRTTQDTETHLLHQGGDQGSIPLLAQHASQPQAGADLQGHRHPNHPAWLLHPDLIGLHLPQVPRLLHQVFMYLFTVPTRSLLPGDDRPFIQTKGGHNRLHRTSVSQQGHHLEHYVRRRTQPVEGRPLALGKCLAAYTTDVTTFFLTVYADVAILASSSCRTIRIGAEYRLWIHWYMSLRLITRSDGVCQWILFRSSTYLTTVLWGLTRCFVMLVILIFLLLALDNGS